MKIWRKLIACWIPKATNPNSEYIILIALPLQQWLTRKQLSVTLNLRCLVPFNSFFFQLYSSLMINENTSLMQLISIYFTYNRSLHVSGKALPIIRRT